MTVLITLSSSGASSGPLYNLYSNIDYVTPLASGVTKSALTAGYSLSGVPDAAITIRITSTGPTCTNSIDVTITGGGTTTTTSTTTAAPSVSLSTATCRSGNCNDNSTCSVRLPVNVYNAPVGYDVQMVVEAQTGASITYLQSNGYATYTENNALATLQVRFDLYDTPGGTLLYSTGTIYLSHQSYWSMLQSC